MVGNFVKIMTAPLTDKIHLVVPKRHASGAVNTRSDFVHCVRPKGIEKNSSSQAQLAKRLKSSQSRVAKMEKGDPTVSVDLLVKSLLAMGADKKSIARAIA
jgi:ribosome-binding protein aMBF1 (putative translation factor)